MGYKRLNPSRKERGTRKDNGKPASSTVLSSSLYIYSYLVEIKDEIQLAHIPKERIEHLDEEVNCLQVGKLVVVRVDAGAEEEACIAAVDNLGALAKLDKV